MMENIQMLLQQLIDLVKSIAPQLWEIAIHQVYAECVQRAVLAAVLLLLALLIFCILLPKTYKAYNEGGTADEGAYALLMVTEFLVAAASSISVVTNIVYIIPRLMNPGYYAIQILLNIAK